MKEEELEERIINLEAERQKKGEKSVDETVEKLMHEIDSAAKPGVEHTYVAKEITKAGPDYLKVHKGGKKVAEKDLEKEFNIRAETYLGALGYKGKQGPEFYGHMIRSWLSGIRGGGDQLREIDEAVKRGDEVTAMSIMQNAYRANVSASKQQSLLNNIKNQEAKVRKKFYKDLSVELGGKEADYLKVVEDLQGAFVDLRRKKDIADKYIKPKEEDKYYSKAA